MNNNTILYIVIAVALIIVCLILSSVIGGVGYYFISRNNQDNKNTTISPNATNNTIPMVVSSGLNPIPILVLKNRYYISSKDSFNLDATSNGWLYTQDGKPVSIVIDGNKFYLGYERRNLLLYNIGSNIPNSNEKSPSLAYGSSLVKSYANICINVTSEEYYLNTANINLVLNDLNNKFILWGANNGRDITNFIRGL